MFPDTLAPKLLSWASILEDNTRDQAITSSTMPFIFPHIALMPDAHLGRGATVGSVIPTLGAIIPAAVGVDIGCGMMAVRTQFHRDDLPPDLTRLHHSISQVVPLSPGKYNTKFYDENTEGRVYELDGIAGSGQAYAIAPAWGMQLGSLGGGNHFIEISLDENDAVWAFLHTGSRGVGNKLASKHIKVAQQQCERRWIPLPDPDLAYLVEGDPEFWNYIEALRWAQEFARLNRDEIMDRVIHQLEYALSAEVNWLETINCHHNYTNKERHFGKTVWLSRKGAIDASLGTPGLIPGSMGARSYVTLGLGNQQALMSSPHGAGRNFSRGEAKRRFNRADLDERMQGIAWGESDEFLDEHPDAYKDIDVVMHDARDLVRVEHTLRQIVNVKGV